MCKMGDTLFDCLRINILLTDILYTPNNSQKLKTLQIKQKPCMWDKNHGFEDKETRMGTKNHAFQDTKPCAHFIFLVFNPTMFLKNIANNRGHLFSIL